jgi:hypothetical protein
MFGKTIVLLNRIAPVQSVPRSRGAGRWLIFACKTGKGRFPQGYQYFAFVLTIPPPPVQGLGNSGGFKI